LAQVISKILTNDYAFTVVILAAGFTAGISAYWMALFVLRRWRKITLLKKSGFKPSRLEKPLCSLFPALFMLALSPFLRVSGGVELFVTRIISLWVIGSCGWLAVGVLRAFLADLLSRYDIDAEDNLQSRRVYTQVRVIENIVIAVIVVITVSLMLMRFEMVRQIGTGLIASAGVMGIVIGFAAQKTLGNFIAGIQIALSQPIRIDDVVIVENEWGWIEEITLTYVVVRIWDLRRLVVPIGYFVERPFQNWTRVSANILGTVYIYADYTVSVGDLRKELSRVLGESPHWDGKVDVLQVTGATDRTVEIRALMSAATSPQAWNLRCEVREKLLEFLQKQHPAALPRTRISLNRDAGAA
jgi:small-conductance mechanosensitive channel